VVSVEPGFVLLAGFVGYQIEDEDAVGLEFVVFGFGFGQGFVGFGFVFVGFEDCQIGDVLVELGCFELRT